LEPLFFAIGQSDPPAPNMIAVSTGGRDFWPVALTKTSWISCGAGETASPELRTRSYAQRGRPSSCWSRR